MGLGRWKMNKELKLLLFSLLGLIVAIIILYWATNRHCEMVEYQDLDGSHFVQVCEGNGY